ncbi:MAG TPA: TRAP transporter small permease [Burkholderiaceae bacterium]|jgi:TRAP-type C4-dicarboxylate transport system permease small subunit|nr:TRAP transporter small permease [Burkholderiaceae bacterium]
MTLQDPIGRVLDFLCKAFAVLGGIVLTGLTLMSVYSVVMRNLVGRPILGDFELVQMGCAVAVATFLPFTQLRGGNIMVDFFTMRASDKTKSTLDTIGAVVLALVLGLLAWRTALGGISAYRTSETTMIMALPVWWGYVLMVPPMALASLTALHTAWRHGRTSTSLTKPVSDSEI